MNTILWIIQVILALFFIMPAYGKLTGTKEKHIGDGHLKANHSIIPIRILGVCELLGCIGIIIPWLMDIMPVLTPVTAVGFCTIMAAGAIVHINKKEYSMLPMLLLVFILSAAVAYFRFEAIQL